MGAGRSRLELRPSLDRTPRRGGGVAGAGRAARRRCAGAVSRRARRGRAIRSRGRSGADAGSDGRIESRMRSFNGKRNAAHMLGN